MYHCDAESHCTSSHHHTKSSHNIRSLGGICTYRGYIIHYVILNTTIMLNLYDAIYHHCTMYLIVSP